VAPIVYPFVLRTVSFNDFAKVQRAECRVLSALQKESIPEKDSSTRDAGSPDTIRRRIQIAHATDDVRSNINYKRIYRCCQVKNKS
jgi:hypothetical protein